jgi:hypothetical protein
MLRMLTWDRTRSLGESGGSSVGKDEESDVERQHLQGGSLRLCRLRTSGLAPWASIKCTDHMLQIWV